MLKWIIGMGGIVIAIQAVMVLLQGVAWLIQRLRR